MKDADERSWKSHPSPPRAGGGNRSRPRMRIPRREEGLFSTRRNVYRCFRAIVLFLLVAVVIMLQSLLLLEALVDEKQFPGTKVTPFLAILKEFAGYTIKTNNNEPSWQPCQYDGHCPMRTSCAVPALKRDVYDLPRGEVGVCEPVVSATISSSGEEDKTDVEAASEQCVDACSRELVLDEHFFQDEAWPVIEFSQKVRSAGRPDGCMLVYHREKDADNKWEAFQDKTFESNSSWVGVAPPIQEWIGRRFRHVIRVDPYKPDDANDERWMAYCLSPCQADDDCRTLNDGIGNPGFTCQTGICKRNPDYWDVNTGDLLVNRYDGSRMALVTAANSAYYRGLVNLAASARYWAPDHPLVVYNLGKFTEEQKKTVRSWSNVVALEWEDGVPDIYPPHLKEGKKYAWKPVIINETLHKYKAIFWLDAGSTLVGNITPAEEITRRTGMFLVKGQDGDMKTKSHPLAYKWFNVTKEDYKVGPHFSGNTQAFLYPSRYVETVVIPNAVCALDKSCIAPEGGSLSNHRYDQTTLSLASYHPKVRAPHYTEFLAARSNALNPDLRKPSWRFVWTSRKGCNFYACLENGGNCTNNRPVSRMQRHRGKKVGSDGTAGKPPTDEASALQRQKIDQHAPAPLPTAGAQRGE